MMTFKAREAYKDCLAHERELLRLPQIAVIHRTHEYIGQYDTDVLVNLKPDGVVETWGANEVPVEAP